MPTGSGRWNEWWQGLSVVTPDNLNSRSRWLHYSSPLVVSISPCDCPLSMQYTPYSCSCWWDLHCGSITFQLWTFGWSSGVVSKLVVPSPVSTQTCADIEESRTVPSFEWATMSDTPKTGFPVWDESPKDSMKFDDMYSVVRLPILLIVSQLWSIHAISTHCPTYRQSISPDNDFNPEAPRGVLTTDSVFHSIADIISYQTEITLHHLRILQ